jgi:hypothetical protein
MLSDFLYLNLGQLDESKLFDYRIGCQSLQNNVAAVVFQDLPFATDFRTRVLAEIAKVGLKAIVRVPSMDYASVVSRVVAFDEDRAVEGIALSGLNEVQMIDVRKLTSKKLYLDLVDFSSESDTMIAPVQQMFNAKNTGFNGLILNMGLMKIFNGCQELADLTVVLADDKNVIVANKEQIGLTEIVILIEKYYFTTVSRLIATELPQLTY